jgi:hypothetical protein
MSVSSTVVFADLTGSTGVFEALGNEKATQAITRLTQLIGETCVLHRGRVVKNLGDGVLALFGDADSAVRAVVQLQRDHNTRIQNWPPKLRMQLRVGVAVGPVVEVDGDTFGDPVNLAARLSDLLVMPKSGCPVWPAQTWKSRPAPDCVTSVRYRSVVCPSRARCCRWSGRTTSPPTCSRCPPRWACHRRVRTRCWGTLN